MICPGCTSAEMVVETYEGSYGRTVTVDVCHACNGIWFDGRESLLLTPGSVIKLFRSMHERHGASRATQVPASRCPRCAGPLKEMNDLANGTRFTYRGCPTDGRFITFFQWLREKALVRQPTPVELKALRARVAQVNCSSCGAPIELAVHSACTHCAAPISFLSEEKLTETLQKLDAKEAERQQLKPEKVAEAAMLKYQLEQAFRLQEQQNRLPWGGAGLAGRAGWAGDLIDIGLSALFSGLFR